MEPFYTIRFKRSVALQFKQFSKRIAKTHTKALEAMLHFFKWHGISPFDQFGPQLQREEEKTRKRIDAMIAIIKDIEKTQTKPTTAMLQALFAGLDPIPPIVEAPKPKERPKPKNDNTVPKIKYDRMVENRDDYKKAFKHVLEKVTRVVPTFGKPYFKLEMLPGELIGMETVLTRNEEI